MQFREFEETGCPAVTAEAQSYNTQARVTAALSLSLCLSLSLFLSLSLSLYLSLSIQQRQARKERDGIKATSRQRGGLEYGSAGHSVSQLAAGSTSRLTLLTETSVERSAVCSLPAQLHHAPLASEAREELA